MQLGNDNDHRTERIISRLAGHRSGQHGGSQQRQMGSFVYPYYCSLRGGPYNDSHPLIEIPDTASESPHMRQYPHTMTRLGLAGVCAAGVGL